MSNYKPITNFIGTDGVDLGKKLITKDYLLDVYPSLVQQLGITPELWSWGFNDNGQLGNATTVNVSTPVTTISGGTNWKQVGLGYRFCAGIKTDGTLWTWGYGGSGTLGNATTVTVSTPVTTFLGGTNWKQVDCNHFFAAAIKTDGTLWTWGNGSNGQLGNASTVNKSTPVTTFLGGTNWKQLTTSNGRNTAAIKTDGTLWIWGNGSSGKLGNAKTVNVSTPVTTFLGGTNWKTVALGRDFCTAIKTDGTLWTWGSNGTTSLGNASTVDTSTPVTTFLGGTNWKQVDAGYVSTVAAIKTDGTLWIWGSNNNVGLLGINISGIIFTSTPVTTFSGGTNWKQVSIGRDHAAAIKTDGTLWTWGYGGSAALGNNASGNALTPITTFAGGTNWKQVCAGTGGKSTAAIQSSDFI